MAQVIPTRHPRPISISLSSPLAPLSPSASVKRRLTAKHHRTAPPQPNYFYQERRRRAAIGV
ncbi:hypothetical protein ACS0TY_028904 [Phlomoides rotata]